MRRLSTKFTVELWHQLSDKHVLLSAVDPPQGGACTRVHHVVCLSVLLTSLLTLTAVWYSCGHSELMTGTSIFRDDDVAVALIIALISLLLAALPLEVFHCSKRKVCM